MKIFPDERMHYMEEIEKWRVEDMELVKKKELIELLEESIKQFLQITRATINWNEDISAKNEVALDDWRG